MNDGNEIIKNYKFSDIKQNYKNNKIKECSENNHDEYNKSKHSSSIKTNHAMKKIIIYHLIYFYI